MADFLPGMLNNLAVQTAYPYDGESMKEQNPLRSEYTIDGNQYVVESFFSDGVTVQDLIQHYITEYRSQVPEDTAGHYSKEQDITAAVSDDSKEVYQ